MAGPPPCARVGPSRGPSTTSSPSSTPSLLVALRQVPASRSERRPPLDTSPSYLTLQQAGLAALLVLRGALSWSTTRSTSRANTTTPPPCALTCSTAAAHASSVTSTSGITAAAASQGRCRRSRYALLVMTRRSWPTGAGPGCALCLRLGAPLLPQPAVVWDAGLGRLEGRWCATALGRGAGCSLEG